MDCGNFLSLLQTILSLAALIVAICIPEKIKWEQIYSQLLCDYYGYDFGAAVMGVVLFFHEDCNNETDRIKQEYVARYKKLFPKNSQIPANNVSNDQNLYYQRRLLTQFYYQLDLCAKSFWIGKRRVQRDFSSKEANLLKILFYMNEATESPEIFMDISTSDRVRKNAKGINSYIQHIYSVLKSTPEYIR